LPDALSGFFVRQKTIQLYEAGEGVSTGLKTMTTTGRSPHTDIIQEEFQRTSRPWRKATTRCKKTSIKRK
jgi:hypothetical protein